MIDKHKLSNYLSAEKKKRKNLIIIELVIFICIYMCTISYQMAERIWLKLADVIFR